MHIKAADKNPNKVKSKLMKNKTAEKVLLLCKVTIIMLIKEDKNEKKFKPAAIGVTIRIFPNAFLE